MRPTDIRYIVVHCSATRASQPYPPEALERDHQARGFHSAGYHFYVRRSGIICPLRPLSQMGAHVLGYNRCSYGVCYEGGLDDAGQPADTRTPAQRTALIQLLLLLLKLAPQATILGHRDLSPDSNGDGRITPTNGSSNVPASMPCTNISTSLPALHPMLPNNSKATLQLIIATLLSLFGIALLGAAFITVPPGEIHSSVLIAYGEVMTFAGALFGIDYHYRR